MPSSNLEKDSGFERKAFLDFTNSQLIRKVLSCRDM